MSDSNNAVIVGGGFSALVSALLLHEKQPNLKIHIVEKTESLGGLYSSFYDEKAGYLDQGMHIIYETSISSINKLIWSLMDEDDWIVLDGNRKDVAGIYHHGQLSTASPYLDLRVLPKNLQHRYIADFMAHLSNVNINAQNSRSAEEYFTNRFGPLIFDELINPVLKKLWRKNGSQLDAQMTRVNLMDRIVFFDEDLMHDLMLSPTLRSRLGFPNQLSLPLEYRSPQRGLYPKKFGMFHVINRAKEKLEKIGVVFHFNSEVNLLKFSDQHINTVSISSKNKSNDIDNVLLVNWASPIFPLAHSLGLPKPSGYFDPPLKQVYIFVLSSEAPSMGGAYYIYSYEKGAATYRITDYASYCPDAQFSSEHKNYPSCYPICVELHFPNNDKLDKIDFSELALVELEKYGIISSRGVVKGVVVKDSNASFPVLTLGNTKNLAVIRQKVDALELKNLIITGQSPEKGIFFLHDVLENMARQLNNPIEDIQGQ